MFKKAICNFCKWTLSKYDNDNVTNKKDIYKKISTQQIIIKKNNNFNNTNNKINRTFYFLNVGNKILQSYMNLCINSYKENNPNFTVKILNLSKEDFYELNIVKNIINNLKIFNITSEDHYKIIHFFKLKFLSIYGGIFCDLNTYCCKNFEDLLCYENFVMSKSINCNIHKDYCCFGLKKDCYLTDIYNVIYPPINYDCDFYESIKLSFYNGNLNKNMFNKIKNYKMHNYIYKFDM